MLHRIALRVLPSLSLPVTEFDVRKHKRFVMFVPGLVAFAIYRGVKQIDSLSDPILVLGLSGLISAVTAIWAYRVGRDTPLPALWRQDGWKTIGWLIGWIGFAYGVQLSLLVLAMLRVLAHYDFLHHPDGPAMMAMIIACTSVARDAFEIGHIRKLQQRGRPVLTFPDGAPLRALVGGHSQRLVPWVLTAVTLGALSSMGLAWVGEMGRSELGQFILISMVAGTAALAAYLAGMRRPGGWANSWIRTGWTQLFQFWWWPGLAFGATYYLVALGVLVFAWRKDGGIWAQALIAGAVTGLMTLYGYYLGDRRAHEDRIQQTVPSSLLRCPFVMGLLSKNGRGTGDKAASPGDMVLGESGRRSG
ncbi:MAG TPA: hypothetical protein VJ692_05130 [Nitrospiraceae bacterium]|nr:hypothetical protein [Nitrospiraceae bacterium]